jgi:hypothetical protein
MKEETYKETNKEKEQKYYFALYFTIAHLASYVAILVLTITIGLILSTTTIEISPPRIKYLIFALITLFVAQIYSIIRMVQLGNHLLEVLPKSVYGLLSIKHPINLILPAFVAFVFTVMDILLVLKII